MSDANAEYGAIERNYPIFERFFSLSREAMFITSTSGKFVRVNASLGKLLGYEPNELFGIDVLKTFENPADRIPYQKSIEARGVVHQYPLVLKRKDGSPLPCFIDAIVWREEGKVLGYHGIIRTQNNLIESFKSYFNQLKEERLQIREQRRNLISDTMLLSRYMSEDVLEYVEKSGENPLESRKRRVTVLFFDIRGSTRIAENLAPELFAGFLNDILTDIMDLVYGCKGSVNKIIGDGLMATFGAPVSTGKDALNAVQAAQEIHDYMKTFNDVRPEYLRSPVRCGLGLATGTVFAGVIGSVRRQEYTVLGDAVNVASRIEALTKSAPEKVLMDEETYRDVKDAFACRKVFSGKLRGRDTSMHIYGLLTSRQEPDLWI